MMHLLFRTLLQFIGIGHFKSCTEGYSSHGEAFYIQVSDRKHASATPMQGMAITDEGVLPPPMVATRHNIQ